ncbi:MFS transporter [Couchioplanes azureus]|uniref:MFS transporter n=1 Tax=Couchioplanes caeruleus TaxID=56438 RepID=UPI0016706FED|nr:MFS transporter [Couchioplanes caeruleus]GGQ83274.1 MFS transporter [Couchioplanes caeruleus subsp. azureus]
MRLFYVRELAQYPTGSRRRRYLLMAVLASLVVNFEGQISPVVPLLLDDLGMSLKAYGLIGAVAVAAGGISAALGGGIADRHGRVVVLVPALLMAAVGNIAMALARTPSQFLVLRCLLLFVEGAAITTTAGLVRDFSPRLGRATAFGFWTCGPVGGSFLAAGVAAVTLPLFGTWQSQVVIIGVVALTTSVVIMFLMADLSPQLRARVIVSETDMASGDGVAGPGPGRGLMTHRVVWAHLGGITLWLVWYWTLSIFGPTLLVQALDLTEGRAAAVMAASWACNLPALVAAGWLSDRLRVRKPVILAGALGGIVGMVLFSAVLESGRASVAQLIGVNALLGIATAAVYAPWMALFSEDVEDLRPDLQATAWGVFGLSVRFMIVTVLVVAPIVAAGGTGWGRWLGVALACNVLFVPVMFLFGGRWRRDSRPADRPRVGA